MSQPLDLDELQRLLWSFATHRVITTAGRVGLLRSLAAAAATPQAVATELGLDPDATAKMIRALHALGLLVHDGPRYQVVPRLIPVLTPGDDDLTPFLEHSHRMYTSWGEHLEPWLRGGEWPRGQTDPDGVRIFGEAMRAMGRQVARRVASALDLEDCQRMLDVGGSFGHYAKAMCDEAPDLTAVVLDRPEVADMARQENRGTPLESRIEFVGGDYHETDFGEDFDLVLLANVLHQESARDAARMVRRGAEALAPGGQLVVLDFQIDDHRHNHVLGALFAINMRDFGDTWTEPDIRGWMQAAGLGHIERTDVGPDRWILCGRASRLRSAPG